MACALVIGGLGILLIVTATNYRSLQDTNNHVAGSDGVVHHTLRAGTKYWVYLDKTVTKPTASVGCSITVGAQRWERTMPFSATSTVSDETEGTVTYQYIGQLTAPATGDATVTCAALSTHWLLKRDSTGLAIWAGACCFGCFVPLLGVLIIVLITVQRRRAHERMTGYRG